MSLHIRFKSHSIAKFEENPLNEDAAKATPRLIAISDGAGGGGLFANHWSAYLLEHLPEQPLQTYDALNQWLGEIWEPFYNQYDVQAERMGGLAKTKFYDEGSFATLVAVWKVSDRQCRWTSFGDSVTFCYNKRTGELQHSFTTLADFNKPPFLLNWKDEPNPRGFHCGTFDIGPDCVLLTASDALSHYIYILMMYELSHKSVYGVELGEALAAKTKNSRVLQVAMAQPRPFEKVLRDLLDAAARREDFSNYLQQLERKGVLAHDDFSMGYMKVK